MGPSSAAIDLLARRLRIRLQKILYMKRSEACDLTLTQKNPNRQFIFFDEKETQSAEEKNPHEPAQASMGNRRLASLVVWIYI